MPKKTPKKYYIKYQYKGWAEYTWTNRYKTKKSTREAIKNFKQKEHIIVNTNVE